MTRIAPTTDALDLKAIVEVKALAAVLKNADLTVRDKDEDTEATYTELMRAIVEAQEKRSDAGATATERVTANITTMRQVLKELRDYFADKADVKDGEFCPIPDANMRWEIRIRQALGEQI